MRAYDGAVRAYDRPHIRKREDIWQVIMFPAPRWEFPQVYEFDTWAELWAAFDGHIMRLDGRRR